MVSREEVIRKIEDYLKGEITKKEASQWVINIMHKTKDSTLLEKILRELGEGYWKK